METRRAAGAVRAYGKGVWRVVIALAALALLAGSAGLAWLVAPTSADALGRSGPAAVAAPPRPEPLLGGLAADAPRPTAAGVAAAVDPLARASALGRFTGVVLDPADSGVLWERTPGTALVPGSTGKLLTAAAALLTLNPTDTLVTTAVAGTDPGTVVLVGGGDPTLTALPEGREGVYPDPSRLADLAEEVRRNATAPVTRVLIDTGRYAGPRLAEGWDPADVPGGFVAPIEPLMLDGGRADPGEQDGARVSEPALAAGRALARLLGTDPDDVAEATAPARADVLGDARSAPVSELVEHMLRTSDNVLAESLAREVAIAREAEPTFGVAAEQTLAALSQAGFDTGGAVLVDGSGLSSRDRVPARLLGAVLSAAAAPAQGERDTQFLRPIVSGLPVAGGDGTLEDRFADDGSAGGGRGAVRAKTGTLTGVSSLAGVASTQDGRLLVFALMSNGTSPAVSRPRLDAIAATLSGCGCR